MQLKPGSRWRSDVCDAEVVVVRPPKGEETLECGGEPMKPATEARGAALAIKDDAGAVAVVGKRYVDEASGLEVLCNKSGKGGLSLSGRPLAMKEAKKLPSSD
ncbi:MAG: hypothetical protein AB7O98_10285 [Hyphomonadaceae bacterium]